MEKPDAKPPNIDAFFFLTVSFELVLLSTEQSLRLLLLLHYSVVRTGHNLHALYNDVRKKSEGRAGIRRDVIGKMNALGRSERIDPFSEEELVACLRKHNSSYSNFRYFQLHRQARLNEKWGFSQRDIQTLHCLALALIYLNMDEMRRRGIGALLSMSRVPASEMTEELTDLQNRMT